MVVNENGEFYDVIFNNKTIHIPYDTKSISDY
jgi:hypothetical protein